MKRLYLEITRFPFSKLSQIILKFHYGGEKRYTQFQGKTNKLFFFNERKRADIGCDSEILIVVREKYDGRDSKQNEHVFLKSHSMVCYPMLCYGMESILCHKISIICFEISMLCYAMVYDVKDKHSATVRR